MFIAQQIIYKLQNFNKVIPVHNFVIRALKTIKIYFKPKYQASRLLYTKIIKIEPKISIAH